MRIGEIFLFGVNWVLEGVFRECSRGDNKGVEEHVARRYWIVNQLEHIFSVTSGASDLMYLLRDIAGAGVLK